MRLQPNVRHAGAVVQDGFLPRMTKILVAADTQPGPVIEDAFSRPAYKIGHEVVGEPVALADLQRMETTGTQ